MSYSDLPFQELVALARGGDQAARDRIFDTCRTYLLLVAKRDLDNRLHAKCGPSDIVQDVLMRAAANFESFYGESQDALFAWLREILKNEITGVARRYVTAAKRDVRRESVASTDSRFWGQMDRFVDSQLTPASQTALHEEAALLREALLRMPEDYRDVLLMRNWERKSFREIAEKLDRSENAAKKLWARALSRLETELQTKS